MTPDIDPCGMAVDLMRSCRITNMRFFRDRPDLTPVRWYFVPEGTPWIPHPHRFLSPDWETDPKGNVETGCSWEITQPWVNGSLPPGHQPAQAGDRPCGPADIWRHGQPTHTANPPVDWAGVPLCCGRHMPKPAPLLWLKPEVLAPGPVAAWPSVPGTHFPGMAGGPTEFPVFTDRVRLRDYWTGPAPVRHQAYLDLQPGPPLTSLYGLTTYVVQQRGDTFEPGGVAVGNVPSVGNENGRPAVSDDSTHALVPGGGLAVIDDQGDTPFLVRFSHSANGHVGLWLNGGPGQFAPCHLGGVAMPTRIRPNNIAGALPANHAANLFEIVVLPYWVQDMEHQEWLTYFREKYPFLP